MTNNIFDDIFNNGGLFGKNIKKDPDPHATNLIITFRDEIKKENKIFLRKEVTDSKKEVYQRVANTLLLETHAAASVFVDNLELGYETLSKIKTPNTRHSQAMGILSYALNRYDETISHIKDISSISKTTALVLSSALLKKKDYDVEMHKKNLESFLDKSSLANNILGALCFNCGEIEKSENYFIKAVEISPNSEKTRLNLMRAKMSNGKRMEVYIDISRFYIETCSQLGMEELTEELEKKEIDIPDLKIKNLNKVVMSLIL